MKKYSNLIINLITFFILILILFNKSLVSTTITSSFYIWFNTLVPSMLPMFILSDILINYNFIEYIPKRITNFIRKLFNISNNSVLILFISCISGFPGNARALKEAYDLNLISKEEVEHLLLFNHFPNPLFVLQTVGVFYLKDDILGIIILISIYISNTIIGIIYRRKNHPTKFNYITNINKSQSFMNVFSNSIKKSINTLLMISGTVTSFLIISTLICHIFNFDGIIAMFIKGILEMTMGLSSLSLLGIKDIYNVVFSSMIISFGGLSIHLQVISILEDIRYRNYFKGRIYQSVISGIISLLLFITFV